MQKNSHQPLTRRTLLRMGASVPPLLLAACIAPAPVAPNSRSATGQATVELPTLTPAPTPPAEQPTAVAQSLPPTPACDDGDDAPTPTQTEGPYYTPNSPERNSLLEPGMAGTKIIVSGWVLSTACQPIARVLLDFWHCDDAGVYDNVGYQLRGHFFSDEQGRYQLATIVPGLYPGRTRHFHVKVQAPNQSILTTQLYFPNEPGNQRDGIFRPECLLDLQDTSDGKLGTFNFVLNLA